MHLHSSHTERATEPNRIPAPGSAAKEAAADFPGVEGEGERKPSQVSSRSGGGEAPALPTSESCSDRPVWRPLLDIADFSEPQQELSDGGVELAGKLDVGDVAGAWDAHEA
jgi:hypothetical protein